MKNLASLELAILNNDEETVSDYVAEIDRKTANLMMKEAGETFGFPTIDWQGRTWTHMGMLSQIFGYSTISGVYYLTEKYLLMTAKIGWFTVELKTSVREIFNLSEKDSQAVFVTWDTILVCGMCGRGERADKVKAYLLEVERAFRTGIGRSIDLEEGKAAMMRMKLVKDEINLIDKVAKMKDGHLKLAAIEALEKLTGRVYDRPKQDLLDFLTPKTGSTE